MDIITVIKTKIKGDNYMVLGYMQIIKNLFNSNNMVELLWLFGLNSTIFYLTYTELANAISIMNIPNICILSLLIIIITLFLCTYKLNYMNNYLNKSNFKLIPFKNINYRIVLNYIFIEMYWIIFTLFVGGCLYGFIYLTSINIKTAPIIAIITGILACILFFMLINIAFLLIFDLPGIMYSENYKVNNLYNIPEMLKLGRTWIKNIGTLKIFGKLLLITILYSFAGLIIGINNGSNVYSQGNITPYVINNHFILDVGWVFISYFFINFVFSCILMDIYKEKIKPILKDN